MTTQAVLPHKIIHRMRKQVLLIKPENPQRSIQTPRNQISRIWSPFDSCYVSRVILPLEQLATFLCFEYAHIRSTNGEVATRVVKVERERLGISLKVKGLVVDELSKVP